MFQNNSFIKNLKHDLPAGIVVFLVALPLCLGISLASGAPLFSGVITGIVGGIVVGLASKSSISVSGPAAGLAIIVFSAVTKLHSFEAFLLAVVIAGVLQIIFGFLQAGIIAQYIPRAVIKGMLAGIGIILILKQIPHAFGYDLDYEGDEEFFQFDQENTFTELLGLLNYFTAGAIIISVVSFAILLLWEQEAVKKNRVLKFIPGPLVVVAVGAFMNSGFNSFFPSLALKNGHLVNIPLASDFLSYFHFPDFSQVNNLAIYEIALTIAIVASIECLLTLEAIDKIDPHRHITPPNWELKAQGLGNIVCGLIGGLPVTAVIVRGSANLNSGAKTKMATIIHGVLLLTTVFFLAGFLNKIPLAALASILIIVGYKLARINLFKSMYKLGYEQFVPFMATVVAVMFTDLLKGVGLGMIVGLFFILRKSYRASYDVKKEHGKKITIKLAEQVSFLNKAGLVDTLNAIPPGTAVSIDGRDAKNIDYDILEILNDYKRLARVKNIELELFGIKQIEHSPLRNKQSIELSYERLLTGNRDYIARKTAEDKDFFKNLSFGQTPEYLWIGCSDSRVPANEITGTKAGEIFVHRNIANMVVHTDLNLISVVQYAVEVLKVKHVIVCGHYGCGGVMAALENEDHGYVVKWLRNIKEVYIKYKEELNSIDDQQERADRLVELNVIEQVHNLGKTKMIQKAWKARSLQIHGWVYKIETGQIKDLKVMVDELNDLEPIFRYEL